MASSGVPYFKAWLIFTISSVLLALGAGMAAGFVMGMVLGIAGVAPENIGRAGALLGFVLGLIVSFTMFRWVVDRYILPAARSTTEA